MEKNLSIDQEEIEDILALTSLQEGLLFHYLEDPAGGSYSVQLILEILGDIDKLYFEQAWKLVMLQNEMLRTIFRWEKVKQPVQLILKKPRVYIRYYDATNETGSERERLKQEIILKDRQEGFDLHDVPFRVTLCKTGKDSYTIIISSHHILYDGWSSGLILKEFFNAYGNLVHGRMVEISLKTGIRNYLKCFQERETVENKAAEYWQEYLLNLDTHSKLAIKSNTPGKNGSYQIKLTQNEIGSMESLFKNHKVTLAVLFYAAWGILIQEYGRSNDVVIGTTVSGRSLPINGIEHTVGLFINTLPLRIRIAANGNSCLDLLHHISDAMQKRREYENTPLVKIKQYTGWREGCEGYECGDGAGPLFNTIVVVENYPLMLDPLLIQESSGLSITSYSVYERNHYDLTVTVKVSESTAIDFVYSEYFAEKDIVRLAGHFRKILQEITINPGQPVKAIDMLSSEEKRQILDNFNDTDVEYDGEKTIHSLFEDQVEKTSDHIAVLAAFPGRGQNQATGLNTDNNIFITYHELNEQTDLLAGKLITQGICADDIVGIMMERSIEMIIGIYGILKAGAAYLPIDPLYPVKRINYILKDSGAKLLAIANGANELEGEKVRRWEGEKGRVQHSKPYLNLAYVIYTSGSSGWPKGVMVDHCSLVNRIIWMQKSYPLVSKDIILQKTPITFDVSVWELFWWGIAGASLCLLEMGGEKDPAVMAATVERHGVSVIHFVPSMLHMMLEYIEKRVEVKRLTMLRRVFSSGEVLPEKTVVQFKRLLYESHKTQLSNLYGPTEATVDVSYYNCFDPGHAQVDIIPIGRPIDNIKLYILDQYGRLVPLGVCGELCIAGVGVARGYLNNPELTEKQFKSKNEKLKSKNGSSALRVEKKFFHHSAFAIPRIHRSKLYLTGDLALWLPDGNIRFMGRIDSQVKIRGFRIELGEIENQLLQHKTVKEAVVSLKCDNEDKYLCAYVVPDKKYTVEEDQLKEYLSQSLPNYMVPARFMYLDKLPITSNGKVDKRSLPIPGKNQSVPNNVPSSVYKTRESEIEKKMAALWQEVLHLEVVDVNDNFFDLGGHSLHVIRLTGQLKEIIGKDIPVTTMFRYPTIRSLVRHLGEETGTELSRQGQENRAVQKAGPKGIAVIGMALRFPGARNCDEFWDNLKKGIESITFFTDEQLQEAGVPAHLIADPNYVKAKGVLENYYNFDALFFGYSPREARLMDPQLRILHECTWEALEHAGYDSSACEESIGLYVGALSNSSWLEKMSGAIRDHSDILAVGSLADRDFFSTRIAYKLNLRGPTVTVQTACSTSLVAIQMAYRALLAGECQLALAGGVAISHEDENGYLYEEGMIRSSDGHCRAFDARADGTTGGNGAGIVLLKPLAAALDDGDFIHAVIKGAAVNNDGSRKIGYTAPSVDGQAAVIRAAIREAEIEPETITYVEAHGTGTKLGDPLEIEALKIAFNSDIEQFCAIGSVKTNIGHLDAAAGVAGFIKTVLALEHGLLPPSLHFEKPNPAIDFTNGPFFVNTGLIPWKSNGPLRAGVSSFGIGGANAHVILEEFTKHNTFCDNLKREPDRKQLLVLSATTAQTLDRVTLNLAEYLKKNSDLDIRDVAYTLRMGRRAFEHRRFAIVSCLDEAGEILSTASSANIPRLSTFFPKENERPVVFMFPGQGTQYVNMGLEIYQKEPLFRETMDHCLQILAARMGIDVKKVLYPILDNNRTYRSYRTNIIDQTGIAQPVIFSIEYALAQLLMAWGIKPWAMIGHSIGEYTAACLAGVFSLEDALELVIQRGKIVQQMPTGAMLAVSLPEERINSLIDQNISLAAVNGPFSCVVAGPKEHIKRLALNLEKQGIQNRLLRTSHAFHSSMMDPALEKFQSIVQGIKLSHPQIAYISNSQGTWITSQQAIDPGYWAAHLRKTVRFSDGLAAVLKEEHSILIEIGPGRTLSTLAVRHSHKKDSQDVLNVLRHPKEPISDHDFLLERVGRMWGNGLSIDWSHFDSHQGQRRIPLPTYPFNGLPFLPQEIKSPQPGKKKDIADWFYIPMWRQTFRSQLYRGQEKKTENFTWLMFMDETGFGPRLANILEKEGQGIIKVEKGTTFTHKNSGIYTIDPRKSTDYEKILALLPDFAGEGPIKILHLWGITQSQGNNNDIFNSIEEDLDFGFYSLLFLAQAIGKIGLATSFHIDIITNDMQPVVGNESLRPGKAAVLGAVKIIPLEYPNVQCRSIDICLPGPASKEEEKLCADIAAEIFYEDNPSTIVAFRGFYRWEQLMEPVRFEESQGSHPTLKEKGVYLITGGLGGIGYTLAEYLASSLKARLILVGRTELTPGGRWLQKVKNLEKMGAEVLAFSCDAADADGMKDVIHNTIRRFGVINGIIHAAGIADYAGVIQNRTQPMNELILSPKIKGTLVLDSLLEKVKPDFMILFSSIGGIAWGQKFGQVAYAAANEFLDVYAFYRTQRTGQFTAAIDWSDWQEVGMAVTAAKNWAGILRLEGDSHSLLKDAILPPEGIEAFRRILAHLFPRVAVSPMDLNTKIENSNVSFHELMEIKETKNDIPAGDIAPTINAIWQDILGSKPLGLHDNFFDLGASSLDIVRVNNRLKKILHKEIPLVTLYTYPTIHSLACHLDSSSPCEGHVLRKEELKGQVQEIERSRYKLNQTIKKMKASQNAKKK